MDHGGCVKVLEKRKLATPGGNPIPDNPILSLTKQQVWEEDRTWALQKQTEHNQFIPNQFLHCVRDLGLITC